MRNPMEVVDGGFRMLPLTGPCEERRAQASEVCPSNTFALVGEGTINSTPRSHRELTAGRSFNGWLEIRSKRRDGLKRDEAHRLKATRQARDEDAGGHGAG